MAKKSNFVVGLELGDDSLKLVALQSKLKQIEAVGMLWNEPEWQQDNARFGKGIRNWFTELKLEKSVQNVAVCVSGSQSLIRLVEVDPDLPLEDAIRFEVRTWSGEPDSEWWIQVIGRQGVGPNGQPAVLVAATPRATVQRLRDICAAAGLADIEIGMDIAAAYNAFEQNYPNARESLSAVVLAQGKFLQIWWTRSGEFLGHAVIAGETPEALSTEGGKALLNGTGLLPSAKQLPRKVYLAGDLAHEAGFMSRLSRTSELSVHALDSFCGIPFPSAKGMGEQLTETAPKCAVSLGLGLGLLQGDHA